MVVGLAALGCLLAGLPANARGAAEPEASAGQTRRRAAAAPRLRVNAAGHLVPVVRAEAAIVYKPMTGEVLWESNSLNQRSIASLTKAMTALVFLQDDPDMDVEAVVTRRDVRRASTTYLRAGERVRVRDLLHVLLIGSDNAAARVLARISPGGAARFIERMNEKAVDIGLASTWFVEPSGLEAGNVSSAYDISRLIVRAAADERLAAIMGMPRHTFTTSRRRSVKVRSTNRLIGGDYEVRAGKTGFIRKAGYCFATLMKMGQGEQVAVVVLGARSSAVRFLEARRLLNWASSLIDQPRSTDEP